MGKFDTCQDCGGAFVCALLVSQGFPWTKGGVWLLIAALLVG